VCYHYGKKTWKNIAKHSTTIFAPTPTIIVISDFKEEEQVERRATNQPIEVERLIKFFSKPIQWRFFEVEPNSPDIPIVVPTKARSKCMMRCNGKDMMKGGLPSKVTRKQTLVEGKKI